MCTLERANGLVNSLLFKSASARDDGHRGRMADLAAVVVDEVHLLGEPHRCVFCRPGQGGSTRVLTPHICVFLCVTGAGCWSC